MTVHSESCEGTCVVESSSFSQSSSELCANCVWSYHWLWMLIASCIDCQYAVLSGGGAYTPFRHWRTTLQNGRPVHWTGIPLFAL